MVLWSRCSSVTTIPYLLIVGSDRVFGVDRSILFVLIVRPLSRFLMTHGIASFPSVSLLSLDQMTYHLVFGVDPVICKQGCVLDGFLISVVVCEFG